MGSPTVIVQDRIEACAAAAAASAAQLRLDIRSAPWVAGAYGPMVFAAMIDAARRAGPEAVIRGVLDCGDSAGAAMAAIRHGLNVRSSLVGDTRSKLVQIADQSGRRIVDDDGPLLDLCGVRDPATACRDWISRLPPAARGGSPAVSAD